VPHTADDRALLVSDDPDLLAVVHRASTRAGADVVVAPDLASAMGSWPIAPLVLLGEDVADQPVPMSRDDVLVLTGSRPGHVTDALARETGWALVPLPDEEAWLADRLSAVGLGARRGASIGVVGGRGGAGASTLAAALAVTAAAAAPARADAAEGVRSRALLVDLDPAGGGADLLLGLEDAPGLRWSDLAAVSGPLSGPALTGSLPSWGGVSVLSWDAHAVEVGAAAMGSVLDSVRRTYAVTVLDLPRRLAGVTALGVAACDTVLLVVPAETRAVAAAGRVAADLAPLVTDVRLVVRGPSPSRLTGPDVARLLGLPLAGWLRPDPRLVSQVERGMVPGGSGRGELAALCRRLVAGPVAGLVDRVVEPALPPAREVAA
jgi:secretion/DNA translocation related CpaE-like protein